MQAVEPTEVAPTSQVAVERRAWLTPMSAMMIVLWMLTMTAGWGDYDIYWHLAVGRLMVEQGRFPSPDTFSWSMAGQTFIAYSAQTDRLLYLLWKLGGATALGMFAAIGFALALLPVALACGRLRLRPAVELVALILIGGSVWPYMGARPHVAGIVLFGFIVYLLQRPFGARHALVVGVSLGAWANLHGSFQVGFGLVGAAVLAWLVARDMRSMAMAAMAFLLGFGLSLLSPFGLRLWAFPFRSLSNPTVPYNLDWTGLRPLTPTFATMGILILLAVAVGVWRATDPRAIATMGLLLPTIQVARYTPFSAPLLGLVTLERLAERFPRLRLDLGRPSRGLVFAGWLLVFLGAVFTAARMPVSMEEGTSNTLPQTAVVRLLDCGQPAPVWSNYDWSGYLLWQGGALYTVGIDGRAETLYTEQVFNEYLKVHRGEDGWEVIVQRSPAQYALIRANAPAAIHTLPGWREVYRDGVAVVAARDGAAWGCEGATARR